MRQSGKDHRAFKIGACSGRVAIVCDCEFKIGTFFQGVGEGHKTQCQAITEIFGLFVEYVLLSSFFFIQSLELEK